MRDFHLPLLLKNLLLALGLVGVVMAPVWASDYRTCSPDIEQIEWSLLQEGETLVHRYDDDIQGIRKFFYANADTRKWTLVVYDTESTYCVIQSGSNFVLFPDFYQPQLEGE